VATPTAILYYQNVETKIIENYAGTAIGTARTLAAQ
jgi:hypothetical protein